MKTEFKESKEFKPVTFCVTFESLKEMEMLGDALTGDSIEYGDIYDIGQCILDYMKKHYNDTNKG